MSKLDERVEAANVPDDMSVQDVIDWIKTVYEYSDPHTGEHPFGVMDYQYMETIMKFLAALRAERVK